MSDNSIGQVKVKRFRSPPYPMFDLAEAVKRVKLLYNKAIRHEVGAKVLADAWGLKSIDGNLWRAASALIQYGLLLDSGSGKSRKFKVTDIAQRITLDDDQKSEKRQAALKEAALNPMIYKELWEKYESSDNLSDSVITTYLTIDRAEAGKTLYSRNAAEEVLDRYRASLSFAEVAADMEPPVKVEHPHNTFNVSLDMDEKVVNPSKDKIPKLDRQFGSAAKGEGKHNKIPKKISAHVEDGRLKITADVDAKEIAALQDMLAKYKEILEMLD